MFVGASSSSDAPDSLKGLVIALTGTMARPRNQIIKIIESNGGE